jgi:hypothetical protein
LNASGDVHDVGGNSQSAGLTADPCADSQAELDLGENFEMMSAAKTVDVVQGERSGVVGNVHVHHCHVGYNMVSTHHTVKSNHSGYGKVVPCSLLCSGSTACCMATRAARLARILSIVEGSGFSSSLLAVRVPKI